MAPAEVFREIPATKAAAAKCLGDRSCPQWFRVSFPAPQRRISGLLSWNLLTGRALKNYRNNGEISAKNSLSTPGLPAFIPACEAIVPIKWEQLWLMAIQGCRTI